MKDIKVLGIDLAKDVFQLHGTDAIRVRVNVYHSIKDRIHDCISTYLAKNFEITSCKTGGVHTWGSQTRLTKSEVLPISTHVSHDHVY